MLFGILKKLLKPSNQGFHHIHYEYPKVSLIDWPSKKIITKGKLLGVPCEVVECGLTLTLEYPGSSTSVPSSYVTLHGKTDTNAFPLNGPEKRL